MSIAPNAVPEPAPDHGGPVPLGGPDHHGHGGDAGDGLDDRSRAILAFEREWWRSAGAKEAAIRERFALSSTRYYQLLNALVDTPAAMAADPATVRRLRRQRARGQRSRTPRVGPQA